MKNIVIILASLLMFSCGEQKVELSRYDEFVNLLKNSKASNKEQKALLSVLDKESFDYLDSLSSVSGPPINVRISQLWIESKEANKPIIKETSLDTDNYFGLKYTKVKSIIKNNNLNFRVMPVTWNTTEVINNKRVSVVSSFTGFKSKKDCFLLHHHFVQRKHYLKNLKGDTYMHWIYALQNGGYATSKSYAELNFNIINRFNIEKL